MNNQAQSLQTLKYPITPYQLFTPISTAFLDNMTYEEQLLGLYKLYNEFVVTYNQIIVTIHELEQIVKDFPEQISALQLAINTLTASTAERFTEVINMIEQGDATTLAEAKQYTDEQIALIPPPTSSVDFGIKANQYDSMQLASVDYDDLNIHAKEYDKDAQIIFFGDTSTVYLQFKSSVTASALETVFDLANPPVKIGRKYQIEISLGNFSLDGGSPAKLEIVGNNTLGNTLPITVPNGGSATVVGIFNIVPTSVRVMSGENQITGYNAYIKIKPLGEA